MADRLAPFEIGAHTHTRAQLDTLSCASAWEEIASSRDVLADRLGRAPAAFAYPHGYSSRAVRALVAKAGFSSAAAVRNALSSTEDDRWQLARLTVTSTTTPAQLQRWLDGDEAWLAPARERPATRAWRLWRRSRAVATGRPGGHLMVDESSGERVA